MVPIDESSTDGFLIDVACDYRDYNKRDDYRCDLLGASSYEAFVETKTDCDNLELFTCFYPYYVMTSTVAM